MAYSLKAVVKASESVNERNDCAVKALALTTRLSYLEAHAILGDRGRKCRKGTMNILIHQAFRDAGYKLERVHVTAKTVTTIERDPAIKVSYNYIVFVRGHVLPIRKKRVLDWTQGRRHRVIEVFKVVKL